MESDLILYSVNAIRSMEVVDISTGSKLGYISDFKIDLDTNKIVSIFLPSSNNKGWFSKEDDIEIPCENRCRCNNCRCNWNRNYSTR